MDKNQIFYVTKNSVKMTVLTVLSLNSLVSIFSLMKEEDYVTYKMDDLSQPIGRFLLVPVEVVVLVLETIV